MKRRVLGSWAVVAVAAAAGPAWAQTKVTERDLSALLAYCEKPVAAVSIGKFSCKASSCQAPQMAGGGALSGNVGALLQMAQMAQGGGGAENFAALGDGMGAALATALKTTNCFVIQEREAIAELQKEAELSGVKLEIKPADYIVTGAITSVAVNSKSSNFGGGMLPVVGTLSKSTKQASLAVDVRVIEVKSSSLKEAKSFQADSTRSNWGLGGLAYGGNAGVFGYGKTTQSPELDSVANETVINAANYLAQTLAGPAVTRLPAPPEPAKK